MRRQLESALTVKPAELEWTLARTDHPDADTEEAASALLRCVVRDPDPANVGRQFSSAAVELALASYPGFTVTAPPGDGQVYGVFTPGYVDAAEVPHVAVHADGTRVEIPCATDTLELAPADAAAAAGAAAGRPDPAGAAGPDRRRPQRRQGRVGQRRGVGAHRRAVALAGQHADRRAAQASCCPRPPTSPVTRHLLPNLRAVNFVIEGILGQGVAYQARFDPQAKGLGEWLRSRHVDIPESSVEGLL